ncbi:ATP-binding protein [Danxiaibacter flavus]|uniref:histidine kinase n=1 Tax=Danxiaibacter flavus TaxID=3049108 RepID=A0ABV3ZCW2_9BACT|nr:ATP-binding protein [Chitinophagaceae bacterium DXS]
MALRLKTKLSLGLAFLFAVILVFGGMGFFYINRLSNDADNVLKNNYESLVACTNISKSLDYIGKDASALATIESNLKKEELNITENGEQEAVSKLRDNFEALKLDINDSLRKTGMRQAIEQINEVNQQAILRKNAVAKRTAEDAKLWLTLIFTALILVVFTFIYNFPSVISNPVRVLAEGITEIANKNYKKRIRLDQNDEFKDLANAFNGMAEKLDEYEHSNLAQIKFEKSRIETIINQMKDGIIGFDANKNILFINVVAQNLLGINEQDIIGRYAADIAVSNDLMRTLLQTETNKKELKIYADNKESYFIKDIFDVTNNQQVIGQVIVLRNITPFHELNEAKTNFIATVSHELKTPISSIKMSASLLNDTRVGGLNGEQQDLIKSINDDSDRLLKITGELLNMSQVETGNIQLKLHPTEPAAITEQAIQAVQVQAEQKKILIRKFLAENLLPVNVDSEKTTWVLINLLTNAIKYSPEETVVDIGALMEGDHIKFYVKDNGLGIDEKYLPKLFDRYFKVPGTKERSGTGLGLAISKEFIEAQGGSIWVNSRIGEGSEFGFELKAVK